MKSIAPFTPLLIVGLLSLASFAIFSRQQTQLCQSDAGRTDANSAAAAAVTSAASSSIAGSLTSITPLADGCYHIYMDLGTNIGIQLRKLYEPDRYPGNLIEPRFSKYFGTISSTNATQLSIEKQQVDSRRNVCAFGWEPNPRHTAYLSNFTRVYQAAGYRVLVATETAVGTKNGTVAFETDNDNTNLEWGGNVKPIDGRKNSTVLVTAQLIDFSEWMHRNVLNRRIPTAPAGSPPPAIVMKVDIEGDDPALLGHLLRSGALCSINYVYVEHLNPDQLGILNRAVNFAGCPTTLEYMDDELFHNDKLPFDPR